MSDHIHLSRVTCAVIMRTKKGRREVLLGQYAAGHENAQLRGKMSTPGGKARHLEDALNATLREVEEETGIVEVQPILLEESFVSWWLGTQEYRAKVTFALLRARFGCKPRTMEPDKIGCWEWFSADEIAYDNATPLTLLALARFGFCG